jgi:hypothetical protein
MWWYSRGNWAGRLKKITNYLRHAVCNWSRLEIDTSRIQMWNVTFQALTAVSMKMRSRLNHHPVDGYSTHLWNVGLLQRDYTVLYPRRLSSSNVEYYRSDVTYNSISWHLKYNLVSECKSALRNLYFRAINVTGNAGSFQVLMTSHFTIDSDAILKLD